MSPPKLCGEEEAENSKKQNEGEKATAADAEDEASQKKQFLNEWGIKSQSDLGKLTRD